MRVFTNDQFDGQWAVGTAAVVVADTPEEAAVLLADALAEIGLKQVVSPRDMTELDTTHPHAVVLNDGNY